MNRLGHDEENLNIFRGKRFRDVIHSDVHLSALEVSIVDTPEFQRLDGLRQLGTAYLLYRGAKHSRFEHALGTVAMTQHLIDMVNRKAGRGEQTINEDAQTIARLCALLHDIGHIPFGHTLEDEGNVVTTKHDSSTRLGRLIGEGTTIGKLLGEELRKHVTAVLTSRDDSKEIRKLQYPLIADLVCNTICADLLDYVLRDIRNTGLMATYDPRFLSYFVVAKDDGGIERMVLRLWRRQDLGLRQDVISDIIHLLRLRYMLAEKVYYHPNKMLTSAMISKAVQCANLSEDELLKESDDNLLARLLDPGRTGNPIAQDLSRRLKSRELYKPLYWVSAVKEDDKNPKWNKVKELNREYHGSAQKRFEKEALLEHMAGTDDGSCIIYCPDLSMQMKSARVLVQLPDERVLKLEDLQNVEITDEVARIKQQHKDLWKFCVFVRPDYYTKDRRTAKAEALHAACVQEFQLPNDNPLFGYAGASPFERKVLELCEKHGASAEEYRILVSEASKLETSRVKDSQSSGFWNDPDTWVKQGLEKLRPKPGKML